jgi:hypothetical protein
VRSASPDDDPTELATLVLDTFCHGFGTPQANRP